MAFLRPFDPADADQAAYICRATLLPGLGWSELAARLAPYVWTFPFTHLRPENCFVLDDGTGKAVGYVLGCPDVFAFVAAYRPYVDQVLASDVPPPAQLETQVPLLVPRPLAAAAEGGETEINPECLVQWAYKPEWVMGFRDKADMLEAHRATLHIDLLPEFQRQGWGRKLVDLFVGSIRQSVRDGQGDMGRGVHLFIGEENKQVVDFYQKCGFRLRDGGDKRTYWLVKDVDV